MTMDPIGRLIYGAVDRIRVRLGNPTRRWATSAVTSLLYDMQFQSLNGVRVDVELQALRPFGRADWFITLAGLDLYYYRLGLIVGMFEGRVTSFEVILDPDKCPDHAGHPFAPGRVTVRTPSGQTRDFTRSTGQHEVLQFLGTPTETGPVIGQTVHTFIETGNFIDTYHEPNTGRLVRVEFCEAASSADA